MSRRRPGDLVRVRWRTLWLAALALLHLAGQARAEFVASDADFRCLTSGAAVQGNNFRVFHSDPTQLAIAVALAQSGSVASGMPEGTILQVIAGEAMAKRGGGFNPLGHGWEFFRLRTTLSGATRIVSRGGGEVVNTRGNSCQSCHRDRALSQDLVVGMATDSGALAAALFRFIQQTDRRCR